MSEFNKTFIHTKDFYNWMRGSGITDDNTPTTYYWFSVYFLDYNRVDQKSGNITNSFFSTYSQELENLRYCIQQVQLPKINYTAYNNQRTRRTRWNYRYK